MPDGATLWHVIQRIEKKYDKGRSFESIFSGDHVGCFFFSPKSWAQVITIELNGNWDALEREILAGSFKEEIWIWITAFYVIWI